MHETPDERVRRLKLQLHLLVEDRRKRAYRIISEGAGFEHRAFPSVAQGRQDAFDR